MTDKSDLGLAGIASFTLITVVFIITEMHKYLGWGK